jgi:hypothetical protein
VTAELDGLFAPVSAVADAVLREGEVLYPYRASAVKNRLRFQWGVVVPRAQAAATGGDWSVRADCVLEGEGATVTVRVRWLAVVAGEVFDDTELHSVDVADVRADGTVRRVDRDGGVVRAGAVALPGPWPLARLTVEVENPGDWCDPRAPWQEVTRRSLVGVHVLAAARGGRFLSCADPPEFARPAVTACANRGLWPVPVGDATLMLAAPIILPDFPEVAPESPGDLCDATEIDELLTLRVLTLTEQEKAEARATHPLSAEIVSRCEALGPEELARLHGAVRSLRPLASPPWWDPGADTSVDPASDGVWVEGARVRRGSRVRLRPRERADAQDLFVAGRAATVEAVFRDVDGEVHVAVVLDDDPGADLARAEGRFRYFRPDELQVLEAE